MTLLDHRTRPSEGPRAATSVTGRVVRSLATGEVRRMVLAPWLLIGAVLTGLVTLDWAGPQGWNGERYQSWFMTLLGFVVAASLATAMSFHRERTPLAEAAPGTEGQRCASRLLAAGALVAVTAAFTAGLALWLRVTGGLDLGTEPGRTLHAHPTLPELLQPVLLTALAVAAGAALGRRLRHRATAALVLLLVWMPTTVTFWAFQAPLVAPFSIVQAQPIVVDVGPPSTDPATFPAAWLLEPPGEYQDHWAQLVVSESLSWWHNGWLLGLSALLVVVAMPPGRTRRVVLLGGGVLAVVSVLAQFWVYPS